MLELKSREVRILGFLFPLIFHPSQIFFVFFPFLKFCIDVVGLSFQQKPILLLATELPNTWQELQQRWPTGVPDTFRTVSGSKLGV